MRPVIRILWIARRRRSSPDARLPTKLRKIQRLQAVLDRRCFGFRSDRRWQPSPNPAQGADRPGMAFARAA